MKSPVASLVLLAATAMTRLLQKSVAMWESPETHREREREQGKKPIASYLVWFSQPQDLRGETVGQPQPCSVPELEKCSISQSPDQTAVGRKYNIPIMGKTRNGPRC